MIDHVWLFEPTLDLQVSVVDKDSVPTFVPELAHLVFFQEHSIVRVDEEGIIELWQFEESDFW